MDFKGSLEENILTLLVWSSEHAPAVALHVDADMFSTRNYRKIVSVALEHLNKYSKAPGVHLRDRLEPDLNRGDEGELLGVILDKIDALATALQPRYVLDQLERWIALRKISALAEAASDAAQRGDLEGAERALYERDVAQSFSKGIYLHDGEAMLSHMDRGEDDFFPSGIDLLDERGVRPERKQLFLIIGPKGAGKSWWLIEIGKRAIMARKKVLHVSLENSEELTARRYTQAIFALTMGKADNVRTPIFVKQQLGMKITIEHEVNMHEGLNVDTKHKFINQLNNFKIRPKLLIKEFPTGTLTIAQLNAYLDMLERTEHFKPDLLLVDSGNKLAVRSEHTRTDMGRNFILLRAIAVARNIAVVAPTHSNRAGDLSKIVSGAAHVGEDYSMLGTADNIVTISKNIDERENSIARIFVDKAREVEDKWIALITQSIGTGQFCLDSMFLDKQLEQEVNRLTGKGEDEEG